MELKTILQAGRGFCFLMFFAMPAFAADSATTQPSVTELQRQRVESARKGMEVAEKMRNAGTVNSMEVAQWTQRWLLASLDTANTGAEREAILRKFVDLATRQEHEAQNMFNSGIVSPLDFETAHYLRIDAELRLAKLLARDSGKGQHADAESLQGTWKVVKKTKNGQAEDVQAHPGSLKFSADKVTAMEGDESKGEGTFTVDDSASPRRITLSGKTGPNAGRTFEAIFELDGDTLKLAYSIGDNAGTPPTDFSGGPGAAMEVLQREKP